MIILGFLVNALSADSRPVPGHWHLDSRAPADSCTPDMKNTCRTLFDIVWGCFATIFACTWVSIHSNVPPPNQSPSAPLWRKLRMMLIAIIAPELMVGFAARQFFVSRWYARKYDISKAHGFFISMGGFVSRSGHHPITTPEQVDLFLADISAVNVEDIEDKSKSDALSKGVALVQVVWFSAQCVARLCQHLPMTELEVTTFAFTVVNVLIWALWWNKPKDVKRPILVVPQSRKSQLDSEPPNGSPKQPIPVGTREEIHAPVGDPSDNQKSIPLPGSQEKSLNGEPWRAQSTWDWLSGVLRGDYSRGVYTPTSYTSVPSFWSAAGSEDRYEQVVYIECLVGTVFGGIHCAASNADFPSTKEMWMWRSCSWVVAVDPVILALVTWTIWKGNNSDAMRIILNVVFRLGIAIYPFARLFLIVLPIISLRTLPPKALTDVNWIRDILHL
ncbi:hypothetical protein MVEN_01713700 [Mycena venus]|uniref:Uncharacterized protein n=1 Tax=Mycena venus TaxID=2733690 RepID=A0A8H6XMY8_9AGAR|nr:hypothetical protein MVEN_01713700 [Mycena venus]